MAGQMNEEREGRKRPWRQKPPGPASHSPALVWLSLVGLLASRARLRFARQRQYTRGMAWENRCILCDFWVKMEDYQANHLPREPSQDATEEYPQSRSAIQVVCVRESRVGGRRGAADDRGTDRAQGQRPADLFGLRPRGPRLRPAAGASLRVCPSLADCRVLRVRPAASGLPAVRRDGGASALGRRQMHVDDP